MNSQPPLSQPDMTTFQQQGFLVADRIFADRDIEQIKVWVDEIQQWEEIAGKYMIYFENSLSVSGQRLRSRIENFFPYHPAIANLLNQRLLPFVSQLLGEPAVLFKEKINFKLPGANGFTPHQDAQAGWNEYASFFITALVSIDASTVENGCLELAAGYHQQGLIGGLWQPLTDDEIQDMNFIAVPTQPGDVIFFDSYAPHRSQPNLTQTPRRVLYLTYNRLSEGDFRQQYYADKRKSYPPDVERDPDKQYTFKV